MNLLVVGASHRTADVALLEQLAIQSEELPETLARLLRRDHVTEAVAVSTCNRVEVYAGVAGFHGGLADISAMLAERAGVDAGTLAAHLYVRWEADAVAHALRVASGLDSMVVGEAQILGQVRAAYTAATEADTAGGLLHQLMQHALRVGKRIHAETGIGGAGRSMVSAALDLASEHLTGRVGDSPDAHAALAGLPALVIGAGAMGSLAVSGLARAGAAPVFLANRSAAAASRLANTYGAHPTGLDALGDLLPSVDVVVTATASAGHVLPADALAPVAARRPAGRPLVICDLAMPRDVDPAAAGLAGVQLIDTERLSRHVRGPAAEAIAAAERIVAAESATVSSELRDVRVAPTVAALRGRADELVAAELSRLARRRPDLTDTQRAEVAHTVHRLVQRLLHQPTVRARQLAAQPEGAAYAQLLAELFDLQVPQPDRADRVPPIAGDAAQDGAGRDPRVEDAT